MPDPVRRGSGPKVIAVTGSTGLVGKQLVKALEADGMRSLPHTQHGAAPSMPPWGLALDRLERLDRVRGPGLRN
jgi:nucleoside-diphosphate-sugar epimerase